MLICWCFCGSFCTLERAVTQLEKVVAAGHQVIPVGSPEFLRSDTRFGKAADWIARIERLCARPMVRDIPAAEPIGPKLAPDLTVVAPCTGNTLAKLAAGISDTPVTLAVKSHLRGGGPLLLAAASNDLLRGNFPSLSAMYGKKSVYFLPLLQDDPVKKPFSAVADFERLPEAIDAAAKGKQLRPLFTCVGE